MSDRTYDRKLKCGCLISSDGGGGLIHCHYGYGCRKPDCNEKHQCEDCLKQEKLCKESWDEWKQTEDYKVYCREIQERNQ